MHCDDKRTLFVLKEGIEKTWDLLKKSDYNDKAMLKRLNEEILEFQEYKKSAMG